MDQIVIISSAIFKITKILIKEDANLTFELVQKFVDCYELTLLSQCDGYIEFLTNVIEAEPIPEYDKLISILINNNFLLKKDYWSKILNYYPFTVNRLLSINKLFEFDLELLSLLHKNDSKYLVEYFQNREPLEDDYPAIIELFDEHPEIISVYNKNKLMKNTFSIVEYLIDKNMFSLLNQYIPLIKLDNIKNIKNRGQKIFDKLLTYNLESEMHNFLNNKFTLEINQDFKFKNISKDLFKKLITHTDSKGDRIINVFNDTTVEIIKTKYTDYIDILIDFYKIGNIRKISENTSEESSCYICGDDCDEAYAMKGCTHVFFVHDECIKTCLNTNGKTCIFCSKDLSGYEKKHFVNSFI